MDFASIRHGEVKVEEARQAIKALAAQKRRFDVIVIDITDTVLRGEDVTRAVHPQRGSLFFPLRKPPCLFCFFCGNHPVLFFVSLSLSLSLFPFSFLLFFFVCVCVCLCVCVSVCDGAFFSCRTRPVWACLAGTH